MSHTLNTPDLVAEAGIGYWCDWVHDDQPFPFRVRRGRLITVPYTVDLNDAVMYRQGFEGEDFERAAVDCFNTLYREGAANGRVMCIAIHPYLMGQPHRIAHLARVLDYISSHDRVWYASGAEIGTWYYENMYESMVSWLEGRT